MGVRRLRCWRLRCWRLRHVARGSGGRPVRWRQVRRRGGRAGSGRHPRRRRKRHHGVTKRAVHRLAGHAGVRLKQAQTLRAMELRRIHGQVLTCAQPIHSMEGLRKGKTSAQAALARPAAGGRSTGYPPTSIVVLPRGTDESRCAEPPWWPRRFRQRCAISRLVSFFPDYPRPAPIEKLKTRVSSVASLATGKAKSNASGAGPNAGTLIRNPNPGATRKSSMSMAISSSTVP